MTRDAMAAGHGSESAGEIADLLFEGGMLVVLSGLLSGR